MDGDWVSWASVGTFAGATSITTVVSNGIQRAFAFNRGWLGLAIAELLCVGGVFLFQPAEGSGNLTVRLFLAVINGFFVFAASAGVSNIGEGVEKARERRAESSVPEDSHRFWRSWF